MSLGIVLKVLNDIYFNDMITLVFETIPQIVFFVCFIGYMCFLILYKWLTPRKIPDNKPLIVSTIIDMFGAKDVAMPMFSGQGTIQKVCFKKFICLN
jgi:V-type H+-transporting ATPase subunit a